MSSNRIRKFTDILEAQAFLNGAVFGGSADVVQGLVGKTFKLTLPTVKSITFVAATAFSPDGDSTALRFKDIKAQIEAVATDVKVSLKNGKICIREVTVTGGVTVDKTGTSTALLGFSANVDTVGKVYAAPPSVTAPCWTFATIGPDNSHIIYTVE